MNIESYKINNDYLCVLKFKEDNNQVYVDTVPIENPFKKEIEMFQTVCYSNHIYLVENILNFLKSTANIQLLEGNYKFCFDLHRPYQGLSFILREYEINIKRKYNKYIEMKEKENPENYDIEKELIPLRQEILTDFQLLTLAYSIELAYKKCSLDKRILTYSHREKGWSDPVYQLTKNFSVELMTNFGYGRASYFCILFKYKNITITPFSDWINYQFAEFSEIIRYSNSYNLRNESWLDALEYASDACNLSNRNEKEFIEKYIIAECEYMVNGLESILTEENFTFELRGGDSYKVDKSGNILLSFRGEKISGALDFIEKIVEYKYIISIKSFVDRIEKCNIKILPILKDELPIIDADLNSLINKKMKLEPLYKEQKQVNDEYNSKKEKLKISLIKDKILIFDDLNFDILEDSFNDKYPDYKIFREQYSITLKQYWELSGNISNQEKLIEDINSYIKKINRYFD